MSTNREEIDPLTQILGAPDLPNLPETIVTTWLTSNGMVIPLDRYARCNRIRWRHLEEPGELLTNAEMAEVLALAEGWAISSEPNDFRFTTYDRTA